MGLIPPANDDHMVDDRCDDEITSEFGSVPDLTVQCLKFAPALRRLRTEDVSPLSAHGFSPG